jgi:hypothetical protein
MHADREHVISVVLEHEDWKEFVKLQPQPVNWLRERIQEMIAAASRAGEGIAEQGGGIREVDARA